MSRFPTFALLLSIAPGVILAQRLPAQTLASPNLVSSNSASPPVTAPTLQASQAASHLDQPATVCGPITGEHTLTGAGTLVDLGPSSPVSAFRVVIWNSDRSKVGAFPATGNVCVSGIIGQSQGIPQIVLSDATRWALNGRSRPASATTLATATTAAETPTAAATTAAVRNAAADPDNPPPPASAAASTPPGSMATPPPRSSPRYRIGPDDALQITVWQEPTLSGNFLVRPDGMISLVLLGDVQASGRTPMQLATDLTLRLKKFLQDPLVAVTVEAANSQKIYLMGEVQRVGPLEITTTMSPLQAIAAAGGLTDYANKKKIYILRGPADNQRKIPFDYKDALKGNPNAAITLLAGDTIVVP